MIFLDRFKTGDDGTFGMLRDDSSVFSLPLCYTVERPYTGEHPCIAPGVYTFNKFLSPSKGHVWLRDDAAANDGRTMIEIHSANWASQLLGCIAVGAQMEIIEGVLGVSDSVNTLKMLQSKLADSFQLTITENFHD